MSISRRQFIRNSLALATASALPVNALAQAKPAHSVGVLLDPLFFKHTLHGHPESAERLKAIDAELTRRDYWKYFTPVKARTALRDELQWVHEEGYIYDVEIYADGGGGYINPYSEDTYVTPDSFDAACMAAGGNIEMNLAVYDRDIDRGFALLRPPGHHALKNKAMGFCIFNSDVIAAKALQKYRGVKKVAIIDFDVHHGNGTQDLTIDDPSILAISIHRHPYWPMTGGMQHVGTGQAKGTNVNIPFLKYAGDQAYLEAYDQVIAPKLRDFEPEQILVFAGYDGHWQDPLADHRLSVNGYNQLVKRLTDSAEELCGGRISFALGGGYKLDPLAQCVAGSMHTLLGLPGTFDDPIGLSPDEELTYPERIQELVKHHLA